MAMRKRVFTTLIFLLILLLMASGCSKDPEAASHALQATQAAQDEVRAQAERASKYRALLTAYVDKNATSLINYAMRQAVAGAPNDKLKAFLDGASSKKTSDFDAANGLKLAPIVHLEFLKKRYAEHDYAAVFFPNPDINPQIQALVTELKRLPSHGLRPKDINIEHWSAALAQLEAKNAAETSPFAFTQAEKEVIVEHIVSHKLDVKDSKAVGDMMTFFVKDESAMPRLKEAVSARAQAKLANAQLMAGLELMTADLCISLARALRFNNLSHLTEDEEKQLGRKPTAAIYDAIIMARLEPWFNDVVKKLDKGDVSIDADIEALYPVHTQYKPLMQVRDRYAEMPDWAEVKPARLVAKRSSPTAAQLRTRLAIEGYYRAPETIAEQTGDVKAENSDAIYDDSLRAAVELYHETHQLDYDAAKGLQNSFWSSLNTTRASRLAQIEENLRRWHKTQLFTSPYYIYINVPDFHGEVWHDGKLIHRFPIVAGNAKKLCDPTTKTWKYINATPLMHARMLYIEYNPYWNVPPRIEQEDYIEKINADPTWLETHGFEYYTDNGYTILRQLPSEKNALGRVKFIFPNAESTFMHDSPQKGLFRYAVRSFSHGCMRVWQPLDLAKILLELDGQWTDSLMTDIEDLKTRRIVLKNRFDVFIDYFNVTVDADGHANFLADPYRYVSDALNPPSARSLECSPKTKAWIARMPAGVASGEDIGVEADDGAAAVVGIE